MHTSTLHRTACSLGLLSVGVLSTLGARPWPASAPPRRKAPAST